MVAGSWWLALIHFQDFTHNPVIQETQSIMTDIQRGHYGNAASTQVTWFGAKQTSRASVYIKVHSTMNLFSVLFII